MLQLTTEQIAAVAVAVVEAKKRLPTDVPANISFFSKNDEWNYVAVFDDRVCDICLQYENEQFSGDVLRALFPFLEVVDLETILPHSHPNCRCRLERTLYFGDVGSELP